MRPIQQQKYFAKCFHGFIIKKYLLLLKKLELLDILYILPTSSMLKVAYKSQKKSLWQNKNSINGYFQSTFEYWKFSWLKLKLQGLLEHIKVTKSKILFCQIINLYWWLLS